MRADSTPAKIGRLMKNCESFMTSMRHVKCCGRLRKTRDRFDPSWGYCRASRAYFRVRRLHDRLGGHLGQAARGIAHGNARGGDHLSGPHMLQAVDDDELVR